MRLPRSLIVAGRSIQPHLSLDTIANDEAFPCRSISPDYARL